MIRRVSMQHARQKWEMYFGNSEGKKPIRLSMRRLEDNSELDIKDVRRDISALSVWVRGECPDLVTCQGTSEPIK